jgi:hypothetical protein
LQYVDRSLQQRRPAPQERDRSTIYKSICSDWLHSIADQVTPTEGFILFLLSRHADQYDGTTKVSAETIGKSCGKTKQYTQDVLQSLASKGLITRTGGGKGPGNAAVYSLLADREKVADFHDDLSKQRAAKREAFLKAREERAEAKAKREKLIRHAVGSGRITDEMVVESIQNLLHYGADLDFDRVEEMGRELVDRLGTEGAALLHDKLRTWTPEKRFAYIESILERSHRL